MVKNARRLSVILPKSGNEKAVAAFLSILTSSVEVLRPATANAKALTSALVKARGDYVYFTDPDALPEKGALSRLIDEGDRDYAEIVRGATAAGGARKMGFSTQPLGPTRLVYTPSLWRYRRSGCAGCRRGWPPRPPPTRSSIKSPVTPPAGRRR